MDNPYDGYIALTTFNVKGYYDDEPATLVKEGEHLLLERKGKEEEEWEFVHNGRVVFVPEELVNKNLKIHSDLYQEQFSHLDKNHLYFGQLDRGSEFVIEENGMKVSYYKIGEYTTQGGSKYNAVREQQYWEADNADEFNIANMAFFKEDHLIEKDYNFRTQPDYQNLDGTYNFMKENAFKFIEPIKVCDYILEHPKMLDVIECLFQGRQLTPDLRKVYTDYKGDMERSEFNMCGFFETSEIPLPDLIQRIEEKQPHRRPNRYW